MFKKELVVIDADLETLARVLHALETVALKYGITAFIDVKPVLKRDPNTFVLLPEIDRFKIWIPRSLYRKVVARVEKVDAFQQIADGEYSE